MSVEVSPEVRTFTLLSLIHGAALEINTNMQMSRHGNCIKGARIQGVIPATGRYTKKQVLEIAIAELKKIQPGWEPTGTVKRALDK